MKQLFILCFMIITAAAGQSIRQLEYFIDTDPGIGQAIQVQVNSGNDQTINFNADVSALAPGMHTLYVRGRNLINKWSLCTFRSFYKEVFKDTTLVACNKLEYFIDTDPGISEATNIPISTGNNQTISFLADITDKAAGMHTLYIRGRDSFGKWSLIAFRSFYKDRASGTQLPNIVKLEHFFDKDPGIGNGVSVQVGTGPDQTIDFMANITNLLSGMHTVYVRGMDALGSWSFPASRLFYKQGWSWTGASDTIWENPANWNPPSIPVDTGYVYIFPQKNNPELDSYQDNVKIRAVDIYAGAKFKITDSVKFTASQDIRIMGTLLIPDNAKPTIELGGNWTNSPETVSDLGFIPGKSTVKFNGAGYVANNFYNITMDSTANMLSNGKITVLNNYVRNKGNLNLRSIDTVFIMNNSPLAIQGSGGIINRGTIMRAIDTITTDPYQFESKDTYIKFNGGSTFPEFVNMTNYPDTNSFDFGKYWAEVPSTVDIANNIVTADNVNELGVWAIGEGAGKLNKTNNVLVKARVRRVYAGGSGSTLEKSAALKMGGLNFKLSLRYEQSEVEQGTDESKFKILRLTDSTVSVKNDQSVIPKEFALHQNYPNPFNPVTTINYALPKREVVILKIFDVLGNEVTKLVDEVKEAGNHTAEFNASKISSGIYFYHIQAGGFIATKKMTLIK